jgi:hypothetical protein
MLASCRPCGLFHAAGAYTREPSRGDTCGDESSEHGGSPVAILRLRWRAKRRPWQSRVARAFAIMGHPPNGGSVGDSGRFVCLLDDTAERATNAIRTVSGTCVSPSVNAPTCHSRQPLPGFLLRRHRRHFADRPRRPARIRAARRGLLSGCRSAAASGEPGRKTAKRDNNFTGCIFAGVAKGSDPAVSEPGRGQLSRRLATRRAAGRGAAVPWAR